MPKSQVSKLSKTLAECASSESPEMAFRTLLDTLENPTLELTPDLRELQVALQNFAHQILAQSIDLTNPARHLLAELGAFLQSLTSEEQALSEITEQQLGDFVERVDVEASGGFLADEEEATVPPLPLSDSTQLLRQFEREVDRTLIVLDAKQATQAEPWVVYQRNLLTRLKRQLPQQRIDSESLESSLSGLIDSENATVRCESESGSSIEESGLLAEITKRILAACQSPTELRISIEALEDCFQVSIAAPSKDISPKQLHKKAERLGFSESVRPLKDTALWELAFCPEPNMEETILGFQLDLLDVACSVNGRASVSERDQTVKAVLSVPRKLTFEDIQLVSIGDALYGIESQFIDHVESAPTLDPSESHLVLLHGGDAYPVVSLPHDKSTERNRTYLLCRDGSARLAIPVDDLGPITQIPLNRTSALTSVASCGLTTTEGQFVIRLDPNNLLQLTFDSAVKPPPILRRVLGFDVEIPDDWLSGLQVDLHCCTSIDALLQMAQEQRHNCLVTSPSGLQQLQIRRSAIKTLEELRLRIWVLVSGQEPPFFVNYPANVERLTGSVELKQQLRSL